MTARLMLGKLMLRRARSPASHVQWLVVNSAFWCSTPRRMGGLLFVGLPPNLKKSGLRRKSASRYMNCFGTLPAQKVCSSPRIRMHCVICAFRLDCRQTTSHSSIVGVVRHSVKLKKMSLVMRIVRTKVGSRRGNNDGQIRARGRNSVGNHRHHRRRHHYRKPTNYWVVAVPTQTMCCVGPIAPQLSDTIQICYGREVIRNVRLRKRVK